MEVFIGLLEWVIEIFGIVIPEDVFRGQKKGRAILLLILGLTFAVVATGWIILTPALLLMISREEKIGTGIWLLWGAGTAVIACGTAWTVRKHREAREKKEAGENEPAGQSPEQ